eukprot:6601716-Pyramimonas_sp.AAC.1
MGANCPSDFTVQASYVGRNARAKAKGDNPEIIKAWTPTNYNIIHGSMTGPKHAIFAADDGCGLDRQNSRKHFMDEHLQNNIFECIPGV